jgi:type IV secretory pathway VirB3-like protein
MASHEVDLTDALFKACTRPPMLFGAPMTPVVLVVGLCFLVGFWILFAGLSAGASTAAWAGVLIMLASVPAVLAMRAACKDDEHRLQQQLMRLRLRLRQRGNPRTRLAHVYAPVRLNREWGR